MSGYQKGYVYINGHLLGRYWDFGPQQRLYCPAVWLKEGENEIVILGMTETEAKEIRGLKTLKD